MKDPRFLPVEYHEPIEESDDSILETEDEELYETMITGGKGSIKKVNLYIAS